MLLLRFPEQFRHDVEAIRDLLLRPPGSAGPEGLLARGGVLVPLSAVADIKVIDGPATVSREFAKRRVVVGANVHERDLGGFVAELQERTGEGSQIAHRILFCLGRTVREHGARHGDAWVIVPITFAAIFFLLFMLFGSVKLAMLIFRLCRLLPSAVLSDYSLPANIYRYRHLWVSSRYGVLQY